MLASAALAVSGLALSALPAQALNVRQEVGVTATTIKLGITVPVTGIAAPGYNKVAPAMKAYFEYVNANGGVYGRNISLVVKDDGYIPTLAVAKTKELLLKDKVFAVVGALGTATHKAVSRSVNLGRQGIPDLFVNTGYSGFGVKKDYPTTFALLPSYIMEAKIMSSYIKENFSTKKIGIIVQDDDFGDDAIAGFGQAGLTFDSTIPYASGSQSAAKAAEWVTKLKKDGITNGDVVILFGVTTATAAALAVAGAYGFKPQWILGSVGGDATTIKAATAVPAAVLNGAIGASFLPAPTDTSDEYIKFFQGINTTYNHAVTFDNNVLVGMNSAMMIVQALRAAGQNPTRKGLITALETKGSTFASAGLAPLGYSANSHVGYTGYWFGKYNLAGELKPVDNAYVVYTTDSGTGQVVKSTYKRPALPTNGLPSNS